MAKKRTYSIKNELITKSREAMLTAVQIFNNPNIQFKSESFIILSNIAWMYMLHAYYRSQNIEYRYFKKIGKKNKFDKTKNGAYKHWELERCLDYDKCPLDSTTKANLKFLIGLRHEVEHQMTTRIDDYLSARFQACCLNYNQYIKTLFDNVFGIDKYLSFSLQFTTIDEDQSNRLRLFSDLPKNISAYINDFDNSLTNEEFNDIHYSYRVLYVPKQVNHRGQADKVIEFIPANSPEAKGLNTEYVLIKEKEKKKFLPKDIIDLMKSKGYIHFNYHYHTELWKNKDAKNPKNNFGAQVAKTWYWYENWIKEVEIYCKSNANKFK